MTDTQNQTAGTALATISPPRLPYPKGLEERFGVDRASWKALVEAVFPAAKTPDSVVLALSYCKARRLDPFKRVVHIVPIWDSESSSMKETVWPGIAEHRTTAFRTKAYAGADAATFGETIERTFEGKTKKGEVKATVRFPEWCQLTVYRLIDGQRVPVPGPRVYWLETYSRMGRTEVPNDMWQKRPNGQIEKCAEAAALRRAFPEELGDEAVVEEAGAFDHAPMKDVTPPPAPTREQFVAPEPAPEPTEADEREADRLTQRYAETGDTSGVEPQDEPDPDALPPWPPQPTYKAVKEIADQITDPETLTAWALANEPNIARLAKIQQANARGAIADRRAELEAVPE
ncbi:MAG: phage recombination protein Bet [Alphaproteobacteria bacterium]|nr:phage recombination protein Bet [Alphaproteobacteria bacterium]